MSFPDTFFHSPKHSNSIAESKEAFIQFWKLGDEFWRAIIDGQYHHLGAMVFDEGLHDCRQKEPGFLASVKAGYTFAGEHLGEKLTVEYYQQLHSRLCSHFKGRETNTEIYAQSAGRFTGSAVNKYNIKLKVYDYALCYFFKEIYMPWLEEENTSAESIKERYQVRIAEWLLVASYQGLSVPHKVAIEKYVAALFESPENLSNIFKKEHSDASHKIEEYENNWQKRIAEIDKCLFDLAQKSGIQLVCRIRLDLDTKMVCISRGISYGQYAGILQYLFDDFHKKVASIVQSSDTVADIDEKITAVAELIQLLEWLHPFADGQTRTNMVLQAQLLSTVGSHPAVLFDPNVALVSSPAEWQTTLRRGIQSFKDYAETLSRKPKP